MGFSTELQGRASHDALLRMQDTEIRLLECIKKCVTQRIKTDRDYATALTNIVNTAHKFENSEFNGPIFVAWDTIVKETENQVKFIQDNMDKLCTKTLDKIHQLITEKKNTRKFYNDEKQRLEMEFAKLKEEVQKQKAEYEKSIEKVGHDKAKYEDLYMKTTTGKSGSKFEEAKNRYHRTTIRMHKVHNDYVLALNEVSFHQDNYLNTMLPSLLDYQQSIQQAMVQQCKEIMCEYSELTDFSSDSFSQSYNSIHTAVSVIKPTTEYNSFVDANRSDQLISAKFEFDKNLLEEYKGTLQANEIALDDLTVENLNHIRSSYDDKMTNFQQKRESKEKDLKVFDEELAKMPAVNQMDEMTRQSFNAHERACQMLKREIQELQCCENKFRSLYNLVNKPLSQLGDEDPPKGLELAEMDSNSNTNPRDSASPSGGSLSKFEALKTQLMKSSPFKKISGGPAPTVQSKNHLETGSGGTTPSPRESKKISRTESHISTDGYQQYRVGENQQPEMTLQPNRKLDEEEWFHGVLPREEVQRLLVEDGDYLVRESKNRKTGEPQYVLSVYWQGHKHFIIQGHENQWRFEGEYFPTIQELILNQHKSGQPVTNKSQAILHKAIYREDWELNNDDIDLCEKIGNGNFGEVFRGVYKKRQLEVAVKTCRDTLSEDMKKKFLQEGRILKQYDHPNVVKFVGIGAQRTPVMIVMEYVPGGALLNFLRKKGAHQSVRQMVKMCEDASAGMEYLEDRGCIHRDLAARNCLVGKSNTVKISDFGMSREEEEYTVSDGLKQIPIKWTAPEALNYGRYTSLCDVWSFGILMWEVFSCGATPYPGLTNNQARDKIDNGYRMPAPEKTPDAIYRLMLRCWEQEPEQRPHFNDIHKDLVHIQKTV